MHMNTIFFSVRWIVLLKFFFFLHLLWALDFLNYTIRIIKILLKIAFLITLLIPIFKVFFMLLILCWLNIYHVKDYLFHYMLSLNFLYPYFECFSIELQVNNFFNAISYICLNQQANSINLFNLLSSRMKSYQSTSYFNNNFQCLPCPKLNINASTIYSCCFITFFTFSFVISIVIKKLTMLSFLDFNLSTSVIFAQTKINLRSPHLIMLVIFTSMESIIFLNFFHKEIIFQNYNLTSF